MQTVAFVKKLPRWSVIEALERLGFDLTRFFFTSVVAGTVLYLVYTKDNQREAVDRFAEWLFYTAPTTIALLVAYVIFVALQATVAFLRAREGFRFEALERHNFVEQFNRAKGDITLDGGDF